MSLFLSILFTTFVVEDWAIAGSLLFIQQGKISWWGAYLGCFLGIAMGDILLYGLGRAAMLSSRLRSTKLLQSVNRFVQEPRHLEAISWAIVFSRAIPGTRFVTYTGAGLASYSAPRFLILTPITVGIWVWLAFEGGGALLHTLSDHWFIGLMAVISVFAILRLIVPLLFDPWRRKALMHTWRRWFIFEFWPAWFAYAPIIPYYAYLSIKNLSFFHPFYANPDILNGGLIGEAKWDILKFLDPEDPATLKAIRAPKEFDKLNFFIEQSGFKYPMIAKPDIGQRGFGVRVLKSPDDLKYYATKSNFSFLIQAKSQYAREAGIFYIRRPGSPQGEICSITDKIFPFVVGDGRTKMGDLILRDRRARIIAPMYFARQKGRLDRIVSAGEVVYLTECGNHSQGAIFVDGQHLRTEKLRLRIDTLAHRIPNFHFGRFDIRYLDHAQLKKGKCFEIVELNGAGADITHIYDERTRVREAYRVMFGQWRSLFEIGRAAKALHGKEARVNRFAFFKEIIRVNMRKHELSVSS